MEVPPESLGVARLWGGRGYDFRRSSPSAPPADLRTTGAWLSAEMGAGLRVYFNFLAQKAALQILTISHGPAIVLDARNHL